jgi:hypothetical protein
MNDLSGAYLADLHRLGLADLRRLWTQNYPTPVPATMSVELLRLGIGYKLQEAMFGGLNRKVLLQLSASEFDPETRSLTRVSLPKAVPKSGAKFIREWGGKVHEVSVLGDGQFAYGDRRFNSLTVIARKITGTHQSGPKFFGIKASGTPKATGRNSLG